MKEVSENGLITYFEQNDKFAQLADIQMVDVAPGRGTVQVKLKDKHVNGAGITHGGLLFTLADVAFGLAANSHGVSAVTLNANISFHNPSFPGQILTAVAEELSLKNRIASYHVSVKDENNILLATMQCQAYRKKDAKFELK